MMEKDSLPVPMRPFALTHVVYSANDPILGKAMALLSLSPIFLIVAQVTIIAVRREWHAVFLLIGQLLNQGCNSCLKRIISQPRRADRADLHSFGYGMPSAHAQFMAFFAVYIWLCIRLKTWRCLGRTEAVGFQCLSVGLCILVCVSRVYLTYHTLMETIVGALVGIAFAWGFHWTLNQWISRNTGNKSKDWYRSVWVCFGMKDSSQIPDVFKWEQECVSNWNLKNNSKL